MESPFPAKVNEYAKFVLAAIGVTVTAILGLVPDGSTAKTVLTIISAVATALLVLIVPNAKKSDGTA